MSISMSISLWVAGLALISSQPHTKATATAAELVDATSKDNSASCDCYLASGPDPGYFQYHRFWDFRNISSSSDDNEDYFQAPALLTSSQDQGNEDVTSAYFNTTQFQADWSISMGKVTRDSPVVSVNSAQNIYISKNTSAGAESQTYLTFRAQRLESFVSVAELESNQKNVLHGSIRGRFRVLPNTLSNAAAPYAGDRSLDDDTAGSNETHAVDNGAVWGFFTYRSDTQESDIEILTSDATDSIRYSNQPDYNSKTDEAVPGASTQTTLPNGAVWTDWLDHRIDWFDGMSRWYVNDQLVLEKTLNVPSQPSELILNLWSDGGSWSGNMSVGSQVTVGVQWIEMAFNTSGKVSGKRDAMLFSKRKPTSCQVACNLDSVESVGFPQVAFNSSSGSTTSMAFSLLRTGQSHTVAVVVSLMAAMGVMFSTLL